MLLCSELKKEMNILLFPKDSEGRVFGDTNIDNGIAIVQLCSIIDNMSSHVVKENHKELFYIIDEDGVAIPYDQIAIAYDTSGSKVELTPDAHMWEHICILTARKNTLGESTVFEYCVPI